MKEVEGVTARKITSVEEVATVWEKGEIPVLIDAEGKSIEALRPLAVADLILAKKNLGTRQDMAPLVIGAGPGFAAGEDVDVVIETMRGYEPGKAIYQGSALENTGIPGMVGGYAKERVIHSPAEGVLRQKHHIGEIVQRGSVIAFVGEEPVYATLTGILRGLIRDGFAVKKGMKIADIDPRPDKQAACYERSDKAIAIAKGDFRCSAETFEITTLASDTSDTRQSDRICRRRWKDDVDIRTCKRISTKLTVHIPPTF